MRDCTVIPNVYIYISLSHLVLYCIELWKPISQYPSSPHSIAMKYPPKNMSGQAPHTLGRYGSFSKGPLVSRKAMVQWRTVSSVVKKKLVQEDHPIVFQKAI